MDNWFYHFTNIIFRLLLGVLTQWDVSGAENIPLQGPLIVAANHISFLDGILLALVIPRHLNFFMKVEGLDIPVIGGLVRLWGAFPVRRGMVDRRALAKALVLLRQSQVLGFFPEGTRGRGATSHLLQRGRPGITVIALRSEAPILPVGITGTENALSRRSRWLRLRRPKIHLNIGEPFTLAVPGGEFDREMLFTLTNDIMYRIADLLPSEYRGYYQDKERPQEGEPRKAKGKIRHLVQGAPLVAS